MVLGWGTLVVTMNITLFFTEADETIFFQSRHKEFVKAMNIFEIF